MKDISRSKKIVVREALLPYDRTQRFRSRVPDLKHESDHANAVTSDADEKTLLRLQLEAAQTKVKAANIRVELARAEQAKKFPSSAGHPYIID